MVPMVGNIFVPFGKETGANGKKGNTTGTNGTNITNQWYHWGNPGHTLYDVSLLHATPCTIELSPEHRTTDCYEDRSNDSCWKKGR